MSVMLIQTRYMEELNETGVSVYLDNLPTNAELTMTISLGDIVKITNRSLDDPTRSSIVSFKGLDLNTPYFIDFTVVENGIIFSQTIPVYAQRYDSFQSNYFHKFSGGNLKSKTSRMRGSDSYGDS